ncbi:MAG TPA: hypothetical protein VFD75_06465, partial [Pyrinomonadaceae bacterium]|nr:hypothetical protein [Pyrinomonadaceae bacterium]
MLIRHAFIKLFAGIVLSGTLLTGGALAQSPTNQPDAQSKKNDVEKPKASNSGGVALASNGGSDTKDGDKAKSDDLKNEVDALKAENADVRELLRRMEEQQKVLLQQVDRLQRRLDATTTGGVQPGAQQQVALADAAVPLNDLSGAASKPTSTANDAASPSPAAPQQKEDRYKDGILIYQNSDDAKVPFMLRFNVNTQVRYLNTLNSKDTFTDHLGVVREVHNRNDITVNRAMFILAGYMFSKKLQYSMTVWTSAGAASIVVAGNIGWRFNKALTVTGGYTGVPGSRSLVSTFPFFQPIDRSMADNFFRPGFTQGVWANGELAKGLNYLVFVGNGLNTLSITANKIDTSLLLSGSVWWEPLGSYSEPGKSWQMYDDYFASKKTRIRIGTSFTRSREDRFSDTDQSSPDNTSIYNSDGVLAFATGAFAPGVTVQKATYKMWAIDGGLKKSGFSINGQYYLRWLNNFEA